MLRPIAAVPIAAAILCAIVSAPRPARAAGQCPDDLVGIEKIGNAIAAEPTCARAFATFDACRYNSGGDVGLATIVIEKCEAGFLGRLSPARRKRYRAERNACRRKYENRRGTMYVSFAVTCEAGVALKYERAARRRR